MTDQTRRTQLNSSLSELAPARGNLLSELSGLTHFIRALTENLPRSARMRRDIGLGPGNDDPYDDAINLISSHRLHF